MLKERALVGDLGQSPPPAGGDACGNHPSHDDQEDEAQRLILAVETLLQLFPRAIDRRTFLKTALATGLITARPIASSAGETLYNGIVLPTTWPPRYKYPLDEPVLPGYLTAPPAVIPIDTGRQLLVDDFLIEETSLTRTFHQPQYHASSPVLKPEMPWEIHDEYADRTNTPASPSAMVFSDGVFFDPSDAQFKMWYMGGFRQNTCLAVSDDGLRWRRPTFDVREGTNIVQRNGRDSCTVWLDPFTTDRQQRFKMAIFHAHSLSLHASPDGVHWKTIGETGPAGDRTTFFYNPFRNVWVFGVRDNQFVTRGRYRRYWEHPRFDAAHEWSGTTPVAWVKADSGDPPRPDLTPAAELYNLDCVGYESVLLGLFSIWRGESPRREKINDVVVGYSRDGFHWYRPDRRPFLPVSDRPGAWNYANVQSAGGCCLIVGDSLYFYMSGRTGIPGTDISGTCSTGLAVLRRDGFASMDWLPQSARPRRVLAWARGEGALLTRPVTFSGTELFVNANLGDGALTAEVVDANGRVVAGLSRRDCVPTSGDGTKLRVRWRDASLARVAGTPVRFRFWLTSGRLYAFWVSPDDKGFSRGVVAAGGPEFRGPVDSPTGY